MHIKLLIGFFVAGTAIVGGYYFLMNNDTSPVVEETSEAASTTEQQRGVFTGSTADLIARGGNWRCTIDATTTQSISSGVTYVSNGKVRADVTTTVAGYGNVESHMIADGAYVYTWSSMMAQGFKTPMTVTETTSTATHGQGMDPGTSYNYDCEPWQADQAQFIVPSGIRFVATPTQQ